MVNVMHKLLIKSIEDYKDYKNYDNKQTYHLAKTLLESNARAWVYVVEIDNQGPLDDWVKLRRLIAQTFKPANSLIILRDQQYLLKQTRTISDYIRDF